MCREVNSHHTLLSMYSPLRLGVVWCVNSGLLSKPESFVQVQVAER